MQSLIESSLLIVRIFKVYNDTAYIALRGSSLFQVVYLYRSGGSTAFSQVCKTCFPHPWSILSIMYYKFLPGMVEDCRGYMLLFIHYIMVSHNRLCRQLLKLVQVHLCTLACCSAKTNSKIVKQNSFSMKLPLVNLNYNLLHQQQQWMPTRMGLC